MTEEQYELIKTAEELGELAEACLAAQKALLKVAYFGWDNYSPKTNITNYNQVAEELADVYLWIGELEHRVGPILNADQIYMERKLETYQQFKKIAAELGRVTLDSPPF